jgi:hypothetical protein
MFGDDICLFSDVDGRAMTVIDTDKGPMKKEVFL